MPISEIEYPREVEGAKEIVEWFGYWPSFHDGEVVSIELNRAGSSSIKVHAFEMTNDLNDSGHYACTKHAVVNFILEGIDALSLEGFNHQNVISALVLRKADDIYELVLGGCYGVEGRIKAANVRIAFEPGIPPDSVYE
jgi:hypothetical protein